MPKERIDANFAVFNGHINNAHERAMQELHLQYSPWAKQIEEIENEKGGIMSIFNEEPTFEEDFGFAIVAYVTLVIYFVNENWYEDEYENRQVDSLEHIVNDLIDDEPCEYDHHGNCQTHGWLDTKRDCPHERGRKAIKYYANRFEE